MINRLAPVFLPLAVGAIIAYLLDPIVDWVEAKYRFSRLKAIIIVFIALGVAQLGLIMTVLPDLIVQANDLTESFAKNEDDANGKNEGEAKAGSQGKTSADGGQESAGPGVDGQVSPAETASAAGTDSLSGEPDATDDGNDNDSSPAAARDAAQSDGEKTGSAKNQQETSEAQPAGSKTSDGDAGEKNGGFVEGIKNWFEDLLPESRFVDENRSKVQDLIADNGSKIVSAVLKKAGLALGKIASLTGFVIGFAMVPVFVFFFLLEEKRIVSNWTKYVPVKSEKWREEIVFVLSSINDSLIVFFRGQVLVGLCLGTLIAIGFSLVGLKYAVLLGIMAAILSIIPYLGVILSVLPALVIAIVQFQDWLHPLLVLLVFVLVQMAEGLVISPKIIGDRVGMHPLTIIIAVLIGTTLLGGIVGGVLAIPLTAALRAIMFRYVWKTEPKKRRTVRAAGV